MTAAIFLLVINYEANLFAVTLIIFKLSCHNTSILPCILRETQIPFPHSVTKYNISFNCLYLLTRPLV
jgi:hypothetical protein